ncbi:MAG: hypothetical protein WDN04_15535 [Rhodospirillales bacterium]
MPFVAPAAATPDGQFAHSEITNVAAVEIALVGVRELPIVSHRAMIAGAAGVVLRVQVLPRLMMHQRRGAEPGRAAREHQPPVRPHHFRASAAVFPRRGSPIPAGVPARAAAVVPPAGPSLALPPGNCRPVVPAATARLAFAPAGPGVMLAPSASLPVAPGAGWPVLLPAAARIVFGPDASGFVSAPGARGLVLTPGARGFMLAPGAAFAAFRPGRACAVIATADDRLVRAGAVRLSRPGLTGRRAPAAGGRPPARRRALGHKGQVWLHPRNAFRRRRRGCAASARPHRLHRPPGSLAMPCRRRPPACGSPPPQRRQVRASSAPGAPLVQAWPSAPVLPLAQVEPLRAGAADCSASCWHPRNRVARCSMPVRSRTRSPRPSALV